MLHRFVLSIIANAVGLYLVDYFLEKFCFLDAVAATCPIKPEATLVTFAIGGALLGVLNVFLKPLLKLLSLPITFLTAGLFIFVVNGFILALLVWLINTLDFENIRVLVTGNALTYIYGAVILGIFNFTTHWLIKK